MNNNSELNDKEMEAVNKLRKRMDGDMEPAMMNDVYLFLRFLKARDFNLDNAELMLRKHLEWREKNDMKNILKFKKTEVIEKYLPYTKLGYDKEGHIIRYFDMGNMDTRGFFASVTPKDIEKTTYYETEKDTEDLKSQSIKHGRNIDSCVFIYNCENFSFATATDKNAISYIITLMNMFMNSYPERLKQGFLLNVSTHFYIIFSVVKTIVPVSVLNKVKLYTDDSYKEDLLKIIDADVLPAFLGGNRTDPDGNPKCLTFVKHGEIIPKEYYLSVKKQSLAKAVDVTKVTLAKASFHEVNIDVKEPDSYLEWEFETKCRDIGFGLFHHELIDGEEKITEIVPIQRIDTELYPETGTIKCDRTGTHVIVFDNTYSWVREKEIYYRVRVITPEERGIAQENERNSCLREI